MANDRHKVLVAIIVITVSIISTILGETLADDRKNEGKTRSLFSPRVDYNEWIPVGRGDPLKNDPTYDYSPPVLDRVQYWGNSNKSKEKKEVLLLGVTSKRSHKKEPKHNTIMRRNFHSQLPTRLMPPPMQTMSPSMKHPSTETYQNSYYRNHYSMPSQGWSPNSIKYGDSNVEESISFMSVSRPNKNSIRNEYTPQQSSSSSKKPWLHALLEKEVAKPSPLFVMQPSKNVYESHPPPSLEVITYLPTTTMRTTTTSTFAPTTEPTYFQPTIPADMITTTITKDPLTVHYDQPHKIGQRPMYLIIEGHSKVKTYGQNDNTTGNQHPPKIVPIRTDEESIIKHVVSEDETGHATEVMHLHRKTEAISTTTTTESAPSAMGDLLSLLDTSLGNFFLGEGEPSAAKSKSEEHLTKDRLEKVETTTKKDESEPNTSQKSDNSPPNTEASDRMDRESRQIFDYDNLPEPSLQGQDGAIDGEFQITLEPKNAQDDEYVTDFDYTSTEIV